jgi:hypothetical protein
VLHKEVAKAKKKTSETSGINQPSENIRSKGEHLSFDWIMRL